MEIVGSCRVPIFWVWPVPALEVIVDTDDDVDEEKVIVEGVREEDDTCTKTGFSGCLIIHFVGEVAVELFVSSELGSLICLFWLLIACVAWDVGCEREELVWLVEEGACTTVGDWGICWMAWIVGWDPLLKRYIYF